MIKAASEALRGSASQVISYSPSIPNKKLNSSIQSTLAQCTLKRSISVVGMGQMSKISVRMILHPAGANTGIVFRRVDLNPVVTIPATSKYLVCTESHSCLMKEGIYINGIEHLLSAFSGLGIDNAYVDIHGTELPYMDSSAADFVLAMQAVGIDHMQSASKKFIRIKENFKIKEGTSWAIIEPFRSFRLNGISEITQNDVNSNREYNIILNKMSYIKELSRARHEAIDQRNLVLRHPEEAIKHRLLDVLGTLYTLGSHLIGSLEMYRPTPLLTARLISTLLKNPHLWERSEVLQDDQITYKPLDYISLASAG